MTKGTILLQVTMIILGSILLAFAYNVFLLPHKVLSGGITGIAMILGITTPLNTGVINFALNIPIMIAGYIHLGRKFICYSILSVATISISMMYIPLEAIADDPLLSSVFGGVVAGIAIGIVLRASGSTGGFDIVTLLILKKKDMPLGTMGFALNSVVIFISGFLFEWELALYTMASIYVVGKVIDAVHTKHVKLTLMIVSTKGEELQEALLQHFSRGITCVKGTGAFTHKEKDILYMVITRYELTDVKRIIKSVDEKAFVNITQTIEVMGAFRRTQ